MSRNYEKYPDTRELSKRYEFMEATVRALGDRACEMVKGTVTMCRKADGSKVTDVDETLNQLLLDRVARQFPNDLVWGEEASNSEKGNLDIADQQWLWITDPIDGTNKLWRSYERGDFGDCNSTVLLCGFAPGMKEPIISAVYSPFQRKQMLAMAGLGGATFVTSADPRPRKLTISGGPQHLKDVDRYEYSSWGESLRPLESMMPSARRIRHQLRMASVALRDTDISAFPAPSHPHDVVPGAHIVQAAGGAVRSLEGHSYEDIDWRMDPVGGVVAAATPALANELVEHLT
ncbi:MAG TPA: inositol monophosphatase family protein [Candidatus Saccharimonadales bacterium]|nr:inositol monophosphatase family protein [Candidatus Saccharimonadales bacterium]